MKTQIPIYVISLSRTPERRLYIQRQLDTFGLDYQFVNAIDKHDLVSAKYRSQIAQSLGIDSSNLEYKYRKNEVGLVACSLSHIKAYNLALENNDDSACILEDDAFLLPTFTEVLKIAATKKSWDILMLASSAYHRPPNIKRNKNIIKHIRIFNKDILFIRQCRDNRKAKDSRIKHLLKEYGFDSYLYPKQSEIITKAIQEYDAKRTELIKAIAPNNRSLFIVQHEQYRALRRSLKEYSYTQIGALPEKSCLEAMTSYHCIAKPKSKPIFASAYLLKESVIVKWKQKAIAKNLLAIDEIPWELYRNEQINLHLITPPCATATYNYLVHSVRRTRR